MLRNSRGGDAPDIVRAARTCIEAGAHGITVHPRPDARHVRAADVHALAALADLHRVELNVEGNPFAPPRPGYPGLLPLCEAVRPAQVTLVPDGDGQLTSDHGFDFDRDGAALAPVLAQLRAWGCRTSVFVDADAGAGDARDAVRAAALGADRVELYTGPFADAHARGAAGALLAGCAAVAARACAAGLGVNAGHDLSQRNLGDFLAAVPGVLEVSIGHALIDEALYDGLARTVSAYLRILDAVH